MKPELDEKLVKSFPKLYSDRHVSMMETCMCWGFDHGDGWFDIIWELSSKLEPLLPDTCETCNGSPQECSGKNHCGYYPRASQVKEKFGTLRFYMTTSTEEMEEYVRIAEDKSAVTCEFCGKPGELRGIGWLFTACEEHSRGEPLTNEYWENEDRKKNEEKTK